MDGGRPAITSEANTGVEPHVAKNIFVLNPASGRKKHGNDILRDIRDAANRVGADFDVYFTKAPGDAYRFIRETCENRAGATADHAPTTPATGSASTTASASTTGSASATGSASTTASASATGSASTTASASTTGSEPTTASAPPTGSAPADGMIRFYGCGGDGTVNELVNGAYGFEGVEVGIIPQGTGNDYIRNYGDPEAFLDIERQLLGESRYSDLIQYRAEHNGEIIEGLCANMFNIGFDSHVVATTDKVKTLPLISGSMAYLASVFITLVKKKESSLIVEYPDGTVYDDNVLLLSIANGCFCGGGIKGVPRSILDDGLMDVSLVKGGVTRSFFVKLFPKYNKGTHLDDPRIHGIIDYRQEPSLTVTCKGNDLTLCVDGEVSKQKKVTFKVIPKAIRFIVPKGL